jgi:curved DNA-binding protein CbpA
LAKEVDHDMMRDGFLPPENTMLEVPANTDITKLPLTAEEGYLLSRIMGQKLTVHDALAASGLPDEKSRTLLSGLLKKGAVIADVKKADAPAKDDPYEGMKFSEAALNEPCDLSVEQKKGILFMAAKIDEWTYYRSLGLKRTASAGEIKKAYFRVSKAFHPDAFFRKELGSYKKRIADIYEHLRFVYEVLSNPERKDAYDETIQDVLTEEEQATLEKIASERKQAEDRKMATEERDKRYAERRRERRLKKNPMMGRKNKATEYIEMAEKALKDKKVSRAADYYRLAMSFAPRDQALREKAEPVMKEAAKAKAEQQLKKAAMLISYTEYEKAQKLLVEIAGLASDTVKILERCADLAFKITDERNAVRWAREASELDPKRTKSRELLLEIFTNNEQWSLAYKEAVELFELKPKDKELKAQVKQLKKLQKKA